VIVRNQEKLSSGKKRIGGEQVGILARCPQGGPKKTGKEGIGQQKTKNGILKIMYS
jgi:hypothetical protein